MPTVIYNHVAQCSAAKLWNVVKKFGSISEWHPAIETSLIEGGVAEGAVGAVRHLTLGDGAVLRERLLSVDDEHMALSYRFEESPLPFDSYVADIKVVPLHDQPGVVICWKARFDVQSQAPEKDYEAMIMESVVSGGNSLVEYLSK